MPDIAYTQCLTCACFGRSLSVLAPSVVGVNFICQYESAKVIYLSVNSFSTQQQNNNSIALCLFVCCCKCRNIPATHRQQQKQQCPSAFHLNNIMAINWWKWRSHSFQEGFEWLAKGIEIGLAGVERSWRMANGKRCCPFLPIIHLNLGIEKKVLHCRTIDK